MLVQRCARPLQGANHVSLQVQACCDEVRVHGRSVQPTCMCACEPTLPGQRCGCKHVLRDHNAKQQQLVSLCIVSIAVAVTCSWRCSNDCLPKRQLCATVLLTAALQHAARGIPFHVLERQCTAAVPHAACHAPYNRLRATLSLFFLLVLLGCGGFVGRSASHGSSSPVWFGWLFLLQGPTAVAAAWLVDGCCHIDSEQAWHTCYMAVYTARVLQTAAGFC